MPQRVIALYGHDAWQDGAVDADSATVVDKLLKGGRLEEQLCDYEVSACLDFLPGLKMVIFAFKGLRSVFSLLVNLRWRRSSS